MSFAFNFEGCFSFNQLQNIVLDVTHYQLQGFSGRKLSWTQAWQKSGVRIPPTQP